VRTDFSISKLRLGAKLARQVEEKFWQSSTSSETLALFSDSCLSEFNVFFTRSECYKRKLGRLYGRCWSSPWHHWYHEQEHRCTKIEVDEHCKGRERLLLARGSKPQRNCFLENTSVPATLGYFPQPETSGASLVLCYKSVLLLASGL
jgi:hypothetical protein